MTYPNRCATSILVCFGMAGLAGAPGIAGADETAAHGDVGVAEEGLGTVDFEASCAEASRQAFDRALSSLHHMMYEQARAGFEEIVARDPDCAMAHWGVGMTLFQPLWPTRPSAEDLTRGWEAVETAEAEDPGSRRERLLVEAAAGFFSNPEAADWWTRIERWADGMDEAYRAHPEDLDTAAFYALSRLALAPVADERGPLHDEAESVLRAVYEEEPTHPGAIHYTIHANDAAGRADRSLDIVRSYGEIAPDVPHALHMPSHIYVRLGEWPEVIDWNRRSADAALKHPAGDAVSHHYLHAADYLLYAFLQRGEDERAAAVLEEALAKADHQRSFISAFHAASMPARYAVERRDWKAAAALEPRSPAYLPWDQALWAEGLTWLARGLGSVHTGDLERALEAGERLAVLRDEASAGGEQGFADYIDIDRRILAGWLARAEDDNEEAVELIRSAAELEGTVEKHPVTPGALLPPHEALGDLLMDLDRPEEALAAYRASSEVWPGRFNTLLGAARAAAAAGDEAAADDYYAELLELAEGSDRAALSEAQQHLES